jgi:hypothetical protein
MVITNKFNLPQSLVNAVSTERHNKEGCVSATTLLKSATETILLKRHWDEIEVDASDSIWQVWGTAVHSVFEIQSDNSFKEEEFSVKIGNTTVTGRVDNYDMENEILADFKTCSVWKITFNDFEDWYKQGMIYAYLMKKSGLNVKKCQFVALIKDHSISKAKMDSSYPQHPVYTYEFDVTEEGLNEIEKFIKLKVADLEDNETVSDTELKGCTSEERWSSETKYAVKKPGRKTALKVCDIESEAKAYAEKAGADCFVERREGEDKKCDNYCLVYKWCPYYINKHKGEVIEN